MRFKVVLTSSFGNSHFNRKPEQVCVLFRTENPERLLPVTSDLWSLANRRFLSQSIIFRFMELTKMPAS